MGLGQSSLSLDFTVSYGVEDYCVSGANRFAFDSVRFLEGSRNFLFLRGGACCGKTHLCHIYSFFHGGYFLGESDLLRFAELDNVGNCFIIDDVDDLSTAAQESLFHLYNRVESGSGNILLTSSLSPKELIARDRMQGIGFADWHSRLRAFRAVELLSGSVDDELLLGFLRKNFHDRQIYPKSHELDYILRVSSRDFVSLLGLVESVHRRVLERQVKFSKNLVRELL